MTAAWVLIVSSLATGFALGMVYFGGLWLTVRVVQTFRQPALCLFVSFVLRACLVLSGFYLATNGNWQQLAVCMAGFLLARTFLIRRLSDVSQVSGAPGT